MDDDQVAVNEILGGWSTQYDIIAIRKFFYRLLFLSLNPRTTDRLADAEAKFSLSHHSFSFFNFYNLDSIPFDQVDIARLEAMNWRILIPSVFEGFFVL